MHEEEIRAVSFGDGLWEEHGKAESTGYPRTIPGDVLKNAFIPAARKKVFRKADADARDRPSVLPPGRY